MRSFESGRRSAPLVICFIALFAVISGSALALNRGEVRSKHIAKNAIKTKHVKNNAVKTSKLAAGAVTLTRLAQDSVDSARVVNNSLSAADINLATLPFWRLAGNAGTDPASDFLGTTDDLPFSFRVNDQRALRIEPALFGSAPAPNLIGGSPDSAVTAGVHSATIAGGGRRSAGDPATANRITDNGGTVGGGGDNQAGDAAGTIDDRIYATVGGGSTNTASAPFATVSGGDTNTASGPEAASVGGGSINTASGNAATVSGGGTNTASGSYATVSGGAVNAAGGTNATVPGGDQNTAAGNNSFAAGRRAKANHQGAFVWGDSTNTDVASPGANTFNVRAGGGFWLGTTSSPSIPAGQFLSTSTGAHLTTGGVWTDSSDRDLKTDFEQVEPASVLAKLAELPLSSWEYKAERGTRHLGPVAQDFYAAFGLGADNRHIAALDSSGVALAAIKGLQEESDELKQIVAAQDERLDALEGELSGIAGAGSGGSGGLPGTPVLASLGIALLIGLGAFAALRRLPARRPLQGTAAGMP